MNLASFVSAQNYVFCSQGIVEGDIFPFQGKMERGGREEDQKNTDTDLSELSWRCGEYFSPKMLRKYPGIKVCT